MEYVPDWLVLWQELVEAHAQGQDAARQIQRRGGGEDIWRERARAYHKAVQERWAQPDSSRDFIAADLTQHPSDTVLDIGAGTGTWTMFLASYAQSVTAVDSSPAMLDVLRENIAEAGWDNVHVVEGSWPDVAVAPHDVVLCSHAMYGVADFAAFVRKMEAVAQRRCYLLLRVPAANGVMAQAARRIWGQPHDSPNFQVAYNAMLQLDITAHVLMEASGFWKPWTNASLDEALSEVKRRFGLVEETTYDAFLHDLLSRHLTEEDGELVWPQGARSALVYWDV